MAVEDDAMDRLASLLAAQGEASQGGGMEGGAREGFSWGLPGGWWRWI